MSISDPKREAALVKSGQVFEQIRTAFNKQNALGATLEGTNEMGHIDLQGKLGFACCLKVYPAMKKVSFRWQWTGGVQVALNEIYAAARFNVRVRKFKENQHGEVNIAKIVESLCWSLDAQLRQNKRAEVASRATEMFSSHLKQAAIPGLGHSSVEESLLRHQITFTDTAVYDRFVEVLNLSLKYIQSGQR